MSVRCYKLVEQRLKSNSLQYLNNFVLLFR